MPNRRACDRCYRYKEKCNFEDDAEICTLCKRSRSSCTTSRLQLRQGRRPKVKALGPHGSVHLWESEVCESTSISTNSSQGLVRNHTQQYCLRASEISDVQLQASQIQAVSVSEPIPYSPINGLNNPSIYQKQIPSPYSYRVTSIEHPFHPSSSPWMINRFYAKYDIFMLGPSFARRLRTIIQQSYSCSPILLHDILMAISPTILIARHNKGLRDQIDIAKGTDSLQKLRTAQITGIQDAFAILALAQTLAAFDLLTYSIGPTSILRYSLLSIQPWYEELSKTPSLDPVTITPIFWDTVQCLIRREVPVIKFFSRDPYVVDHMAGLCTTLLPLFYDLCVESNALKLQMQSGSQIDSNPLRDIEERLLSWQPNPLDRRTGNFTDQEILKMEAQKSMYRTAGLLICHRNLNPIGTLDDVAVSYAKSIMVDFSRYSDLVSRGTRLQNIAFPILIAMFEISDITKEILWNIPLLAASPICISKMLASVEYVWRKKQCGCRGFIFDLVDNGPDFIIVP